MKNIYLTFFCIQFLFLNGAEKIDLIDYRKNVILGYMLMENGVIIKNVKFSPPRPLNAQTNELIQVEESKKPESKIKTNTEIKTKKDPSPQRESSQALEPIKEAKPESKNTQDLQDSQTPKTSQKEPQKENLDSTNKIDSANKTENKNKQQNHAVMEYKNESKQQTSSIIDNLISSAPADNKQVKTSKNLTNNSINQIQGVEKMRENATLKNREWNKKSIPFEVKETTINLE